MLRGTAACTLGGRSALQVDQRNLAICNSSLHELDGGVVFDLEFVGMGGDVKAGVIEGTR